MISNKLLRQRWWIVSATAAAIFLAGSIGYAAWALVTQKGMGPTDVAGVTGMIVGAVSLWASLQGLRTHADTEPVKITGNLAAQVKRVEATEWRQLLGGDSERIDVAFTFLPEMSRNAEVPLWQGSLSGVMEFYQTTHPRRLVITGSPGAGKTVLALELLLSLLDSRRDGDPVPVRISAASWDTGLSLEQLLIDQLIDAYGLSAATAKHIVETRHVLPVLDGLDEMDIGQTPVLESRASAALEWCNSYQDGRDVAPLVLTCRADEYEALENSGQRVLDAARIEINPPSADQVCAFLNRRVRDPYRWQSVTDTIAAHPSSTLARTLSTPWQLTLAIVAYDAGGDPDELLTINGERALAEHLLARFIPAVMQLSPRFKTSPYQVDQVERWLAELANYLNLNAGHILGGRTLSGCDIVLHHLWPLGGHRMPRLVDATLAVLSAVPLCVIIYALSPHSGSEGLFIFAYSMTANAIFAIIHYSRWWPHSQRLNFRRMRSRSGIHSLPIGILGGTILGIIAAPSFGASIGLTGGILFAISYGISFGLTGDIEDDQVGTEGPEGPLHHDALSATFFGLICGPLYGFLISLPGDSFIFWITFSLAVGITNGATAGALFHSPRNAVTFGLISGIGSGVSQIYASDQVSGDLTALLAGPAFALLVGFVVLARASRRYYSFLLCMRGRLPWRLKRFLRWSYSVGILRASGIAYQFRHLELQDWLALRIGSPTRIPTAID
ncbi:NACHT domain-containing protein [Streptomyces sp. NBC_01381]|uniref:NACHT domain-containing protein n=1 Tax=Streptomyces sp. NBC_01381 TaxID=2903845 RepID=UPI00224FAB6B|nr:NACHT domain-containing protein [Streptomyces sp. NBC_01381]MCX4671826.1 NACHT domain-containing protein [Streptomyces sp. NBC_01381]